LWFEPYTFEQLKQIISTRLGENKVFEPMALSAAVHEVSQTHVSLSTFGTIVSLLSASFITIFLNDQNHINKTSIELPPRCPQSSCQQCGHLPFLTLQSM